MFKAVQDGEIPCFRIGRMIRIRPSQIPASILTRWEKVEREPLPEGELVYFLAGAEGFVKIGYTANLRERIKDLQVGCHCKLQLLAFVRAALGTEREYHRRFGAHRCEGEWFAMRPEIQAEIERLSAAPL